MAKTPRGWDNSLDDEWPLEPTLLERLEIGDIVQHANGELWMVADVGYRSITAIRTVQLRNPTEWRLVSKAHHTET